MSVEYINPELYDPFFTYYFYDLYVKGNCLLRYLNYNEGIFEANEIINGLYLGNINSAYDIDTLKKLGITSIISVLAGFNPPYVNEFNYLVINALDNDTTDLINQFESTNTFIDDVFEKNEKILVHCHYGKSRSVAIIAAYLIKTFGISIPTSLDLIKSKRGCIDPKTHYIKQLNKYFNKLYTLTNHNDRNL
jgi:hypothetical protein